MLRKAEDDFGFSDRGEDKPASPAEHLGTLLREGPPLGVHTLVWCDTLNNLNRTFDRQALREFEIRVLFQMSANDSSNLIDSPWPASSACTGPSSTARRKDGWRSSALMECRQKPGWSGCGRS